LRTRSVVVPDSANRTSRKVLAGHVQESLHALLTELLDDRGPTLIAFHLLLIRETFYRCTTLRALLYYNRGFSYIRWPKTSVKHLYRIAPNDSSLPISAWWELHKTFGPEMYYCRPFDRLVFKSRRNKQSELRSC